MNLFLIPQHIIKHNFSTIHHIPSLTLYQYCVDGGLPTLKVQTLAEDVLPPDHHVHRRAKTLPPVKTHAR